MFVAVPFVFSCIVLYLVVKWAVRDGILAADERRAHDRQRAERYAEALRRARETQPGPH